MVDELLDTVGPLAAEERQHVDVCRAPKTVGTMHGDLMKTRQILLNLLEQRRQVHARRHHHAGRRAPRRRQAARHRVHRHRHRRRHDRRSSRRRSSIPSRRPTSRRRASTAAPGLGLAIVSRFCQLMGGERRGREPPDARLACSPSACRSTSFATPSNRHGRRPRDRAESAMPTILVVEDNEPSRDALSRRLERRGYSRRAGRGRRAGCRRSRARRSPISS